MTESVLDKLARLRALREQASTLATELEELQKSCSHEFGEPVYDPLKEPQFTYSHLEWGGSDPRPVCSPAGDKLVPRWRITCRKCGRDRYTQKTRIVQEVPDFD